MIDKYDSFSAFITDVSSYLLRLVSTDLSG
jgi:hypothetical protein